MRWGGSCPHCQASEPFVGGMCLIKAQWMDGNFPAHFWQTSQSPQSHSNLLPRVGDIGHEYERVNEICIQRSVVTLTPLGTAKTVTVGNCHSKRSLMLYEESKWDCQKCHCSRLSLKPSTYVQRSAVTITADRVISTYIEFFNPKLASHIMKMSG